MEIEDDLSLNHILTLLIVKHLVPFLFVLNSQLYPTISKGISFFSLMALMTHEVDYQPCENSLEE